MEREGSSRAVISRLALTALVLLVLPHRADAYIGPGAGFAVLSSFLVLFTTIVIAIASLLIWPFRALWRVARGQTAAARVDQAADRRRPRRPGSEADRSVHEGRHPAELHALAKTGCYRRLKTTFPSISPVAWSSFSTGAHPARHNIFDFLDRDRRTYLAVLSSTHIGKVDRFFKLGRYRIPLPSARAAAAAQVEAVLDDSRRAPHLEHGAARADHLSARQVLRRRAERDVRARSARHAGHLPALHHASGERAASRKAASASTVDA